MLRLRLHTHIDISVDILLKKHRLMTDCLVEYLQQALIWGAGLVGKWQGGGEVLGLRWCVRASTRANTVL